MAIVKNIILRAYGERTEDGRFIKEDPDTGAPLSRKFKSSAVFPIVFMDVCFDSQKAAAFISGCIPDHMKDSLDNAQEEIQQHLSDIGVNAAKPSGSPDGKKIVSIKQ